MNAVLQPAPIAPPPVCFHCAEPIAPGTHIYAKLKTREAPMCCEGCRAVAELIAGIGLEDYYRYRSEPAVKPTVPRHDEWQGYDEPAVAARFVHDEGNGRYSAMVLLDGLRCAACAWLIERVLRRQSGVLDIGVNIALGRARLVWSSGDTSFASLLRSLARLGYRPTPVTPENVRQQVIEERRTMLKRLGVAGLGMMQVMMYALPLYAPSDIDASAKQYLQIVGMLLTTPVLFYAGWPFLANAVRALRVRAISMDVPVSIALLLAYLASVFNTLMPGAPHSTVYFDSISMFIFLLTLARFVEMTVRHRSAGVSDALARAQPSIAQRLAGTALEAVDVAQLNVGDELWVRAGEAVPADGVITAGCSTFNESLLTGESLPVARGIAARVVAGAINIEAPVQVRVTAVGTATVLSNIALLLQRGQADKPRVAVAADRAARVFLRWILVAAGVVGAVWWHIDPQRAFPAVLAVLVATCPCALSLAAPAVVAATCAALARRGLLVTRADAIERLASVEHLVFDKTGTLTNGDIAISGMAVLGALSAVECKDIAAALERGATHPIAHAFKQLAGHTLSVEDVKVVAGAGVEGRIHGVVYRLGTPAFVAALHGDGEQMHDAARIALGDEHGLLASFTLSDTVRDDARLAVHALRDLGVQTSILSGDAVSAVAHVAIACGIDRYRARLTPAGKLAALHAQQRKARVVGMVGDGINDAPVLGAASPAIAMGTGAALAQASADMVLMNSSLCVLPEAIALARRARRIMRQNLLWAALYNFSVLPPAALGLMSPWLAAAGMALSSVLVVLNAARVLRTARRPSTAAISRPAALHRSATA